uniref:Uncharacterized protein n=1 Tax=Timema cristinae TaxID=61476 RepID=A0A7R9CCF9_TIMCR|nr:unnamed protein product [Timema cristinae]
MAWLAHHSDGIASDGAGVVPLSIQDVESSCTEREYFQVKGEVTRIESSNVPEELLEEAGNHRRFIVCKLHILPLVIKPTQQLYLALDTRQLVNVLHGNLNDLDFLDLEGDLIADHSRVLEVDVEKCFQALRMLYNAEYCWGGSMSVMNTEQTHPNASSSGGPPENKRAYLTLCMDVVEAKGVFKDSPILLSNFSKSVGGILEQRHAGTPTDLRVGTAVALSSVAKYWVLTNLFPGPIPQVSVYGLHPPRPCDGSKPQDGLSQHQQHCLPALPPPPGVNMATDTMSLLPQHPHSQVAGLHMDQGPLDNSDKNKIDKGTCTVERCGDNQRLVAKGNNSGRSRNLPVTSRWCKAALARSLRPFLFLLSNWSSRLQQDHPRLLPPLYSLFLSVTFLHPQSGQSCSTPLHPLLCSNPQGSKSLAKHPPPLLCGCSVANRALPNHLSGENKKSRLTAGWHQSPLPTITTLLIRFTTVTRRTTLPIQFTALFGKTEQTRRQKEENLRAAHPGYSIAASHPSVGSSSTHERSTAPTSLTSPHLRNPTPPHTSPRSPLYFPPPKQEAQHPLSLHVSPTTRKYLDSFRQQAPLSPLSPTRPAYHLKPLATPTRAYQFSPTFIPYTGQGDPRIAKATQANIVPAKQAPVVIKQLSELF